MESRSEIAKYFPAEARVASVGIDAGEARAIAGTDGVARFDTPAAFLSSATGELHALILSAGSLTTELLGAAPGRLEAKSVVVVTCPVVPGVRFIDNPSVAPIVRTLSEAGYSILTPPRWLDRAEEPSLLVVARHDGFAIRDYIPGDETRILDLFETSFHQRRAEEHWRWEYERNPHGSRVISLAFDAGGELVAQYAGYPVSLWSSDPSIDGLRANQIGDTMTALRVRNVGRGHTSLVVRTAKHFFSSHCAGRVAFNYGFNTANIRKISSSFNESDVVEPIPYRRCATDALLPAARDVSLRRLLRRWSVRSVSSVDEEWDRFFAEIAPAYRFLVRRDTRHLRWRYLDSPVWKYELVSLRAAGRLVGWSVFRRIGDVLVWGDALFAPKHAEAAGLVLRHALCSSVGLGATAVEAWFPSRPSWWGAILGDLGLGVSKEPNDLAFMCTPFLLPDATARLRHDFYYSACDSDLF